MMKKRTMILASVLLLCTLTACTGKQESTESITISESQQSYTLQDGEDITITSAGTYEITGEAKNVTITIKADETDEVELVLDSVSIVNDEAPAVYVASADKVSITTTDTQNSLQVSEENDQLDAAIYSEDDLELNGDGTLTITSASHGISVKDSLNIAGGSINITASKDGLHAEDNDDDTVGSVSVSGGAVNITAEDDGIHATTTVEIDGGTVDLTAAECVEGTYIKINGGDITINASDDGINASQKSSAYTPTVEINDGSLKITMGAGDTDGIDSNGNIYVNGGTIDITGQSTFDYDGEAKVTGGTIIENGTETNTITNQSFGGPDGAQNGGEGRFPNGDGNGGPGGMRPEEPKAN